MSSNFIDRSAVSVWSPIETAKSYLALGGIGTTDGVDSSRGSQLEIYAFDPSNASGNLSAVCHQPVDSQFRSIAWANIAGSSMGVIAGGMANGQCILFDASRLIQSSDSSSSPSRGVSSVLFSQDLHNGKAIACMEFNPQKNTLLGTGGYDGSVQVMNIERPHAPDIFRGVTTTKHVNSEVQCLSWNRKVQHILASASNQGLTVVWDLKNKKEVVTIKDPVNRTRCSALSWNPEIPTQLMIAYNDDHNPCVQLWDMRNCSFPFREFQPHSRGVTHASFCESDSNLLVSSGRDNRSICWSLHSGALEPYAELSLNSPAFKMDWSTYIPGFVSASSMNGTVSIHSIAQRQTPIAAKYPPKWAKLPCGVSLGFGGKVVTFGTKTGPTVGLHIVPDEPAVVMEADKFEQFLGSDLRSFCATKSSETQDDHDRLTWTLISLLHDGVTAKREVVAALGVDPALIQATVDSYLGKQNNPTITTSTQNKPSQESEYPHLATVNVNDNLDQDQLDSLFDQIARHSEQQQFAPSAPNSRRGSPRGGSYDADDNIDLTDWSKGPEAIIKQSLLIGDLESAVDCCMKCGRFADALFLSAGGNADLWRKTREEYARKQKDPFIKLIGHVMSNDLEKFVSLSELGAWVETLAILVTYASGEQFVPLVEMLARRLENERFDVRSAVLCYLACGSFSNTVRIWASMSHSQGSQSQALQDLVEKMSCLFQAIRPSGTDPIFASKVQQYATMLANSGCIMAAMRCLLLIPDSAETRILKDRIFNAAPSMMGNLLRQAPPFPFEVHDVKPQPSALASHAPQNNLNFAQRGHGFMQPTPSGGAGSRPPVSGLPNSGLASQPVPQVHQHGTAPIQTGLAMPPPTRPGVASHTAGYDQIPQNSRSEFQSSAPHPGMGYSNNTLPPPPMQRSGTVPSVIPGSHSGAPALVPNAGRQLPSHTTNHVSGPSPVAGGVKPVASVGIPPYAHPSIPSPAVNSTVPMGQPLQRSLPHHPGVAPSSGVSGNLQGVPQPQIPHPPSYSSAAVSPMAARPVVGPPTSSGVSTAPHATANPVTAGMPVSWPIPTPVQQQLSPGVVPPPRASTPLHAPGEPVSPADIAAIQRSLTGLLERCSQDGNRKKWEDTSAKLNELYRMLAQGLISRESVTKVKELCSSIDRNDFAMASRLRVELSASDWERNRTWLFAIQLLLPK